MYHITIFSFLKTGQYVYFTFLEILFVLYLAIKKKLVLVPVGYTDSFQ